MKIIAELPFCLYFSPELGRTAKGFRLIGQLQYKPGYFTLDELPFSNIADLELDVGLLQQTEHIAKHLGFTVTSFIKKTKRELQLGELIILSQDGLGFPYKFFAIEII